MRTKKAQAAKCTHGEVYVQRKESIDFKKDLDEINVSFMKLPPRMPRVEAMRYYSLKLTKYWLVALGTASTSRKASCKV
ncbi:MAG: hypothetical protein WC656_01230 [Sulfurimonas sp.]|jgi:hypothetical protein